jgi:hypothetical protein
MGMSCELTYYRGREALVLFVALLTATFVRDVALRNIRKGVA